MINYLEDSSKFDEWIKEDVIVVDFFATWCGPCKMLNVVLEELITENKNINILKLDIDKFPDIALKYSIMSVPTIIVFKNGNPVKKEIGFKNLEEIKKIIEM